MRPGQGSAQPDRVDPPEVVLGPIDEGDRHLVGVTPEQLRIGIHVAGGVGGAGLRADGGDHLDRLLTQVTALASEHHDPRGNSGWVDHPPKSGTSASD